MNYIVKLCNNQINKGNENLKEYKPGNEAAISSKVRLSSNSQT